MSATPETDAAQHEGLLRTNPIPMQVVTANFARRLERERDEEKRIAEKLRKERFEARKFAFELHEDAILLLMENSKLRDIAERAIELVVQLNDGPSEREGAKLRAELEQLKEGGK